MAATNFVDQVTLYARSGKGGRGSVHFRREKYIPLGGPDGGSYWSGSARSGTNYAYHLYFGIISSSVFASGISRSYGCPVRCVLN